MKRSTIFSMAVLILFTVSMSDQAVAKYPISISAGDVILGCRPANWKGDRGGIFYCARNNINDKKMLMSVPVDEGCGVGEISIDPSGRLLAYIKYCDLSGHNTGYGYFTLGVINIKDEVEIARFDHGGKYVFSPDGKKLVYDETVSGEQGTPAPPGFKGGMHWVDLQTKKTTDIEYLGVAPTHLAWSEHDGNIYFSNHHDFVRYDVAKGKSQIMPELKGIDFSSDGLYYISIKQGLIYRAADNQPIEEFNRQLPLINTRHAEFISWLDRGKKLLVYCGNYQYHVFDLKTRSVIQDVKGHVLGTNPGQTKLLIYPGATDKKGQFIIDRNAFEVIDIQSEKPR